MFLYIIQLSVLKHSRRHIGILNAVIRKQSRSQISAQIHLRKLCRTLFCDFIAACPKLFLLIIRKCTDPFFQDRGFFEKHWQSYADKCIGICPHLLRRGNDDSHPSSPSICAGLSAAFTFPNALIIIPFSSIR